MKLAKLNSRDFFMNTNIHALHEQVNGGFRCAKCGKLLAKNNEKDGLWEVKCSRCGNLNLLFDEMLEQIVITDPGGTILYANEATVKLSGFTLPEIVGKTPALWGGHMPKEFYDNMWKIIKEEKKTLATQVRNKKKTGEFYNALLTISPVLDTAGEIALFIGIERLLNRTDIISAAIRTAQDKLQ